MRRMTCFVMALALVLGLAQCKKEKIEPANGDNTVRITLNVDGSNDNGTRAEVLPPSVNFVDGDQILVASGGKYVGTLTRTSGVFSGNITDPVEGQRLYFYFLGNKQGTLENGAETCTVNISDQTDYPHLPVISMGKSNVDYSFGVDSYTSRLYNKASLMKFNVTTPSTAPIYITGMNNQVTVHFNDPTDSGFEYGMSQEDGGLIKLAANSTSTDEAVEKWAIVLPQDELEETRAYSDDGYYMGECTIHEIDANKYYDGGISLPVNEATPVENPLTFEAKIAGTTVTFNCINGISAQYRINDGSWQPYTSNTGITLANVGDKVSFRGNNVALAKSESAASSNSSQFSCNNNCYVYGSVMSLLYPTGDAAVATSFPEGSQYTFSNLFYQAKISLHPDKALLLPATQLTGYCYYSMFYATELTQAPELPATTLALHCYHSMFQGSNLVTAPDLPATVMAPYCYYRMFHQCRYSLTTGPVMHIDEVAEYCCTSMFYYCEALVSAPIELSAPSLAPYCYGSMFEGCKVLTSVPELPATSLASSCYSSMFSGCRALVSFPQDQLPATTLALGCYASMFKGTGLETAPELPATTLANYCYQYMFRDCSGLETAPDLPATTLVQGCYSNMFRNCSNLTSITCLATSGINQNNSTSSWLQSVASNGMFTKESNVPAATSGTAGTYWRTSSVSGIPSGWSVQNYSPN